MTNVGQFTSVFWTLSPSLDNKCMKYALTCFFLEMVKVMC